MNGYSAVFVDRDGTVNKKPPTGTYIADPAQLELIPEAVGGVRRLNQAGIPVVVVTNQRGIARGLLKTADLHAVHRRLENLLGAHGAHLDAIYWCAHEIGRCACRKPQPGMLRQAARDYPAIRLETAVMVGDVETDVLAGRAAGTRTVRLGPPGTPSVADVVSADLGEAVDWILERGRPCASW